MGNILAQTCPNRRPASFSANSQVCRTSGRRYLGARRSSRFRCGAKKPRSERIGADRTGVYLARSGTELWSPAAVLGTKPIQPGDANWREAWQSNRHWFPEFGNVNWFRRCLSGCCSRPQKKGLKIGASPIPEWSSLIPRYSHQLVALVGRFAWKITTQRVGGSWWTPKPSWEKSRGNATWA